ncbi:hypothetical protein MKW92_049958 [Papaver armeniacum]|nr:hypothetical protein MKW92_049958 [Papaver armeniacum]
MNNQNQNQNQQNHHQSSEVRHDDDAALSDFLASLMDYTYYELVEHYVAKSGFQCPDVRLIRLVAVATQKFIAEVATDALQHSKARQSAVVKDKKQQKDKRLTLTMDDLSKSLREQIKEHQLIGGDCIKITLPDGNIMEGKDMNRPFEGDCQLEFFTFDSDEGGMCFGIQRQYGCKLCTGSCSARGQEGFHYDAFYGDLGLNENHLKDIEKAVKKVLLKCFSENKFKVEIIKELSEDKAIAVYRCGPLVDLCSGPHIPNTSFVKAISLLKASLGWISFPDRKRLKEYLDNLEEAKEPGSPFIKPHGTRIYNRLVDFMKAQYWERGYDEVMTPNAYKYKENMFVFKIDKQEFGLKLMNCPGHCLMFDGTPRSYKELPLRMADGALSGLTRVRRFVQDDAHIFCRESQIRLKSPTEKYLGEIETWDKAEGALTETLTEFSTFNCHVGSSCAYSKEDGAEDQPVMIHRAVLGSLEHTIHRAGYYVDVDVWIEDYQKNGEAQLAQYNYMLVVGEKEVNNQTVSRRDRDDTDKAKPIVMSAKELLEFFKEEAAAFSLKIHHNNIPFEEEIAAFVGD